MPQKNCLPMNRFMEVCLLFLLSKGDNECHGYSPTEKLKSFGFAQDELNISTLYRTLRHMEQSAWVRSHWESGGQEPQRRVYSITAQCRDALADWVQVLKARRARIGLLLDAYEQLRK